MAIEDNDPERRNLVVTATAFIAYYYGGGHFSDNTVTLEVVNVNFFNPGFLAAMAWAGLLWFMYRYWVTHAGIFRRHFAKEFGTLVTKTYVQRYVARRTQTQFVADKDEGLHVSALLWFHWRVWVTYINSASNVMRHPETKQIQSYSGEGRKGEISFNDFRGWFVALRATGACFFRYPSFSGYVIPYLLFTFAAVGPIYRYWL